jgi:tRNA-dihydrouridine synthase B
MVRIGPLTFPNPFFMAPMAGVTDSIVRLLARRFQCGMVYTEMVSSYALARDGLEESLGRMHFTAPEKPIAIQLFGSEGATLAKAARKVQEAGADMVDINLGCSVAKIAQSGAGAFLCQSPKNLRSMLSDVVQAVDIPVTIKIRKGWDDHHLTAFEVAQGAQDVGVAAIAIHARTSRQMYSGTADWDFIKELKARLSIPVIGNGDVNSADDAVRMLHHTGCDAVMIGRASRGNPWIFREALSAWQGADHTPPPSLDEKKAIMIEHLEACLSHHGEAFGVPEMRKFLSWYTKGLPASASFRDRLNKVTTAEALERLLDEFFYSQADTRNTPDAVEHSPNHGASH